MTAGGNATKQLLRQRIDDFTRPDVLRDRLGPHLAGGGDAWEHEVVQLDSTGAATVEIRSGSGPYVFAKFFPNGAGDRYQVVEPLGYLPEYNLLFTRRAPGQAVSESVAVDGDATSPACGRPPSGWPA